MLSISPNEFLPIGQFPRGVGTGTLASLVLLGLAELNADPASPIKLMWRILPKGSETIRDMKLEPAPPDEFPAAFRKDGEAPVGTRFMRCCCRRSD